MKPYLVFASLLLLAGCGGLSRGCASVTGYDRTCINGVSYQQFTSGATVEYQPDGTIKRCNS